MKLLLQSLLLTLITFQLYGQNIVQNEMSKTISPQEDFYMFVNEKWINTTEIPAGKGRWGAIEELQVKTNKQILNLLDSANPANYPVNSVEIALLKYYKSGMDVSGIENSGINNLDILIKPIKNIKSKEDVLGVLRLFFEYNIPGFIGFEIFPDMMDNSQKAIYMMPGSLGLPNKSFYSENNKEVQQAYVNYLETLFKLIDEQKLSVSDAFSIENSLASGMLSEEDKRNPESIYNKRTLEQLDEHYSWSSIIQIDNTTSSNNIIVMEPGYLKAWETVLVDSELNQIKSYLLSAVLRHAAPLLGDKWAQADFNFYHKTMQGKTEASSQSEKILGECNKFFGETIGKLFVEQYFSESSKIKIEHMVNNIKMAFANRIKNLDWMSNETKSKAIAKLEAMKVKIGYPDKWSDFTELPVLGQSGLDYYINHLKIASWNRQNKLAQITENEQSKWFVNPHEVGASSSPILNEIQFPAGSLQPPFYDQTADDASNYGAIGVVIGHEISHGFDDIGIHFDANGSMVEWWAPEEKAHFEILKKAVVEHYETYEPIPGHKINGTISLGENIADIAGVAIAFDAMKNTLETKDINGFNNSQRFFIAYAMLCREKLNEAELLNQIQTNPHCPGKYRFSGAVSHIPEFYKEFNIINKNAMFAEEEKHIKIW